VCILVMEQKGFCVLLELFLTDGKFLSCKRRKGNNLNPATILVGSQVIGIPPEGAKAAKIR